MRRFPGLALALLLSGPAAAEIVVDGAWARASGPQAQSGAAFMTIRNTGADDARLVAAEAGIARMVELHPHVLTADGVMQMREVEDGFVIPAGGEHRLDRGGDHVMFMGLTAPMEDGTTIPVTLVFERAGPVTVDIPVDSAR